MESFNKISNKLLVVGINKPKAVYHTENMTKVIAGIDFTINV